MGGDCRFCGEERPDSKTAIFRQKKIKSQKKEISLKGSKK